jgi:hypothetical protein
MAACSFDMQFTFVWAGWEGSAHDTRIFYEAIGNTNIQFPRPPEGINPEKKYGCSSAGLISFSMKYFVSVKQLVHLCREVLSR